jgi:hypothetical protein
MFWSDDVMHMLIMHYILVDVIYHRHRQMYCTWNRHVFGEKGLLNLVNTEFLLTNLAHVK